MEELNTINLKTKDEQLITCDVRLLNFSSILQNSSEKNTEIPCK